VVELCLVGKSDPELLPAALTSVNITANRDIQFLYGTFISSHRESYSKIHLFVEFQLCHHL
jgi:hypothetical protein